jgi:hypothetical protein
MKLDNLPETWLNPLARRTCESKRDQFKRTNEALG